MTEREEKFEKMLKAILDQYDDVVAKMEKLKVEDKTKTVTYKQLMATKLSLGDMIAMYKLYGLLEE